MNTPRHSRFGALLILCGACTGLLVVTLGACEDNPAGASNEAPAEPGGPALRPTVPSFGALSGRLPSTDTVTSSVPAFEIKQKGGGIAGRFEITNPNSAAIALDGVSSGTGHALLAWNLGRGRGAVVITSNSTNTLPALDVSSQSLGVAGTATSTGVAAAADIRANNSSSTAPAVNIATLGTGTVLQVNHRGAAGSLAIFQLNGSNRIRFTRSGQGMFNGGTKTGGADVAEAFEVEGQRSDYQPGDVLVISQRNDRRVEKSREPYSTRVIGVYATKPGVLLTERDIDESLDDMVPVGVVGVIPTRVSAENGAIRRGDLLVTAGMPGHAMRAEPVEVQGIKLFPNGTLLGKALEAFDGPGAGVIRVMVNVK